MKRIFLLLFLGGFFVAALARQDTVYPIKTYHTTEVLIPPEIDGSLSDDAWNSVDWEGGFQMFEPYDDRPPSHETKFKVVFDKDNIYIGIRAYDSSPDSIVKRATRRDEIDGDFMALQFDSYHDHQTGFAFFASVAGSKMDNFTSNDGDEEDATWDPIWWVGTQIDNEGWTMEAKIPFSQLRFDKHSDGTWGMQVGRGVFRNSEVSIWQPISREASGWIHLLGEIHGLENINPRKQAELIPYALGGIDFYEKDSENPFMSSGKDYIYNAGLDAKVGITNNFTLDLTVNPDFGQVEADPSEVNLTAFESYFQEKRPFFIEGKNIFDFGLGGHGRDNLFYSRRIGRRPQYEPDLDENEYADVPKFTKILGAAKLSGKTRNGLSVGIMESVAAREVAEIDSDGVRSSETVEPLTNYFAGRIIKDINKGNSIVGGMFTAANRFIEDTHLDFLHTEAYTGGLDYQQYFLERAYSFKLSGFVSHVKGSEEAILRTQTAPARYFQRPDADYVHVDSTRTSLSGYGGVISFDKLSGKLIFGANVNFKSPGLELNDIGFIRSTDEVFETAYLGYRLNEPFSVFRKMDLRMRQFSFWDFGGNHQMLGTGVDIEAEYSNFWSSKIDFGIRSDGLFHSPLRGGPSMRVPGEIDIGAGVASNSRKKFRAELHADYSWENDDSGYEFGSGLELAYKPIGNLLISLEPGYERRVTELQYVMQEKFDGDTRYVFGTIDQQTLNMSMRIDLVLSPQMTIQFWGQPFIASGQYSEFKYITDPKADTYRDRFRIYDPTEISYNEEEELYSVSESGSGLNYSFENPDFNIKEFLSNLVFRWEYRPGSFIYLVWTQTRAGFDPNGDFHFRSDFLDMWDLHPRNTILLKFSYRIGR